MKKILLIFIAMLAFCSASYATTNKQINFIYIHGANQGPIKEFTDCVDKMHPYMIKNLENSDFVSQNMLKGATIDENYNVLYWADKTQATKANLRKGLAISKQYTPIVPQSVKELLSYLLHDAVWIQKDANMRPVINDLHKKVMDNYKNGKKTILVGYSAGTFITYQYIMNNYKYLDLNDLANKYGKALGFTNEEVKLTKQYAPKSTCINALIDSKMVVINGSGVLVASPDKEGRKARIKNLKKQTELSCAPDDAVIGVLNFASPVTIFFSEVMKKDSQAQIFAIKMTKYTVENDKFFLTVNYAKDPFGVPFPNRTYTEMGKALNTNIKNNHGFMYNKMLYGGRNLAVAHSIYWMKPNTFTKEVAKAYEEGYKSFYQINE